MVAVAVDMVTLGAEDVTSVPMLCASGAELGAGFVVTATGAVPVCSFVG